MAAEGKGRGVTADVLGFIELSANASEASVRSLALHPHDAASTQGFVSVAAQFLFFILISHVLF